MPSELTNTRGLSHSSFFHEEGQVMAPKMDHMSGYYGSKTCINVRPSGVASSALGNNRVSMDSQKGYDRPEYHLSNGRNVSSGNQFTVDHDAAGVRTNSTTNPAASFLLNGSGMNLMGAQYENSLFSSSLSDLFIRKLKLPADNVAYGHSVDASQYEEEMALQSLKEIEAHTIGNLLPDEDDLFSGVTDGFDRRVRVEDSEDLDLFSSVGGLELGEDGSSMGGGSSHGGEHPFGENPSRTLFVRNINSSIEDSELRTIFEQFGDISILYTTCKHRGFVMISYYDLRASCSAIKALQGKALRRRKLDIHFSIPKDNSSESDINLGTIVVFNDSSVSNDELLKLFGVYGEIKEIRDVPQKNHHKFVEFYDVRSAESALRALNRCDMGGKQTNVESGRPQEFHLLQQHSLPTNLATGFSGPRSLGGMASNFDNLSPYLTNRGPNSPLLDNMRVLPNGLSSLIRVESGNQYGLTEETSNLHPHSLPEYYDGLSNGTASFDPLGNNVGARPPEIIGNNQFHRASSFNEVFGNGSCPPSGSHYLWSNSHTPQSQTAHMWPNSPSFVNGMMSPSHPQRLQRPPQHMLNVTPLPINNHHMGSAPAVNHLLDRRHSYAGESPDLSLFNHPGSLGNMRISGNSPHHLDFNPRNNVFTQSGGNCMDVLPIGSKTIGGGLHSNHQQRCSLVFPERHHGIHMGGSFDSPSERTTRHHRRHEGSSSNQGESKKQFDLDLDRILRGDDKRTTLMIKNIPNKYTSKMLLSAIDDLHRGTYDFIYLPIDFKNKCNVGYAFINMTDPTQIIPFYKSINGRKWEKFNSEKVATLAYARIQGKAALIAHFQNSSLMNEDKRCRPILFHTDGPNAGDQVPFPMGSNIRHRPGKNRGSNMDNNQDYANRDSSSSDSGKESE